MTKLSEEQRWQALMRGQVMAATTNKFSVIIRLLDQKAQVMILLNSVLVPVCINALEHGTFKNAATLSIITAVLSIISAIICIYPKRRYRKLSEPEFNILHFNDMGHMEEHEYLDRFMPLFNDLGKLAETVAKDLYDTSRHAILPKYVWLKIAYAVFVFGNLLAICAAVLELNQL